MVDAETKRRYNREYRARLKAYMGANPNAPRTRQFKEYYRQKSEVSFRKNMELYAEAQKVIRPARKARGWTQKQLGEMLGVSWQSVSHYEHGRMKAPWDKLYEIMPELKEAHQ